MHLRRNFCKVSGCPAQLYHASVEWQTNETPATMTGTLWHRQTAGVAKTEVHNITTYSFHRQPFNDRQNLPPCHHCFQIPSTRHQTHSNTTVPLAFSLLPCSLCSVISNLTISCRHFILRLHYYITSSPAVELVVSCFRVMCSPCCLGSYLIVGST